MNKKINYGVDHDSKGNVIFNKKFYEKLLKTINKGLCTGVGNGKPGNMCIEAVVCNLIGKPEQEDQPIDCVIEDAIQFKIDLNDTNGWSSNKMRAWGLRRAGTAQIGSKNIKESRKFLSYIQSGYEKTFGPIIRIAMLKQLDIWYKETRIAIKKKNKYVERLSFNEFNDVIGNFEDYSDSPCEILKELMGLLDTKSNKVREYLLFIIAEICVQALKKCGSPGAKYLYMCPFKLPPCPKGMIPCKKIIV